MLALATSAPVPAKSGLILMGRILGYAGQPITQASLTSIEYTITDLTTDLNIVSNQPLTISAVIFDNLQQADPTWRKDSQLAPGDDGLYGYNFRAVIPAADLAPAGDRMQIDVVFVPVTGEQFVISYEFSTLKNYV